MTIESLNLEALNQQLFFAINAPTTTMTNIAQLAVFVADYVLYLIPLFLVLYWLLGNHAKKQLAPKSVAVALLALGIAQIIGMIYPHPRPFMIGVGHTLIPHIADPSFPSDHMTLFSAIGMAFMLSRKYLIGAIVLMLGVLVAWSRIYLGVHFPFDMVGAFILSSVVAMGMEGLWGKVGDSLSMPFIQLYEFFIKQFTLKNLVSRHAR